MTFLEKDLEEIIYNSHKSDYGKELSKKGIEIQGLIKRQVRIGNYGVADLITVERDCSASYHPEKLNDIDGTVLFSEKFTPLLKFTIYELKKDKIGISALLQAVRYAKGLKSFLYRKDYDFEIRIVLIGKEIDISGSFPYLVDIFDNIEFYTYNYGFNGISFNQEYGYKLTNENF